MTIHPIVFVAARQPQLIAAHVKAYADLLLEEGRRTFSSLLLRATLYAVASMLVLLGVVFGGMALLLYAAVATELRNGWLLVALPCSLILIGGVSAVAARALPVNVTTSALSAQLKEDIDMIHEVRHP